MLAFAACVLLTCSVRAEGTVARDAILADPEAVSRGAATFARNCAICHGKDGSGGRVAPLQNRKFEADYLYTTITKGRRRGSFIMPPWENSLPEDKRRELVRYILSLSPDPGENSNE